MRDWWLYALIAVPWLCTFGLLLVLLGYVIYGDIAW